MRPFCLGTVPQKAWHPHGTFHAEQKPNCRDQSAKPIQHSNNHTASAEPALLAADAVVPLAGRADARSGDAGSGQQSGQDSSNARDWRSP